MLPAELMSQLKEFFSYAKFKNESLSILQLDKNYFLQRECRRDLQKLGHTVHVLPVADNPKTMLDQILKTCLRVKPDFIFGTNHIGFDPDGQIAAVLSELNLPVAFWYLDDYRFIIPDPGRQAKPNIALFSFEQTDPPRLKDAGFKHAFYLPAGSTQLPDQSRDDARFTFLQGRPVFVGNTFLDAQQRWFKPHYPDLYTRLNLGNIHAADMPLVDNLIQTHAKSFPSQAELFHFAGYAAGRSTMEQRIRLMRQIPELVVFGDRRWAELNLPLEIHPPVDMVTEAPSVFRSAQININMSSTQLVTSVNQRVFDVPMAGGFLLTDWRDSLASLFDEKTELAVYRSPEELKEKIDFYRRHAELREKISTAAAARVQNEHLLIHRMRDLVSGMRQCFGR